MVTSDEWLRAGNRMWNWDGSYPTMVAIVPRDGEASDIRWFEGPARSTLHFLNAVTEGDKVMMDLPTSNGTGGPQDPSQYRRWTFDLNSSDDRMQEEVLFAESNGLLSRMDDRFLSLPYRYVWSTNSDPTRPWNEEKARRPRSGSNVVQRLDVRNNRVATWHVGDVQALQEPTFVPRKGSTEEGDGYFMVVATNYEHFRSELKIVDATRMEEVATVILPFRLRSGTHGQWISADQLPFSYAS
jgi:carotenoid cleavage dioxygenase